MQQALSLNQVPNQSTSSSAWHAEFLKMLPAIQRQASLAFRELYGDDREEAIQETLANALRQYVRLMERDRTEVAAPTQLARYAIAQVRDGREVGTRVNSKDVLSPYAQRKRKFHMQPMDHFDRQGGEWWQMVVEDKRSTPAEIACFRIDFREWLKTLSCRLRHLALLLASGERSQTIAQQMGLTPGRVCQQRRELKESWEKFQNSCPVEEQTVTA